MIRAVELGLFLLPFALFAAWWFLGATASRRLVWAACGGVAVIAAALLWYGLDRGLGKDEVYMPARMENGVIVPGEGVRTR